jgi:predicted cupin superfamily sugar epimerase
MKTAKELIAQLDLTPHPEGGWYRELHRSSELINTARGPRSALTSIYYLLEAPQFSRWHVVASDEIWHFHDGSPLELLVYRPATRAVSSRVLGIPSGGYEPSFTVSAGDWQAARPLGAWTLVGCDVGPGFDFEDFQFISSLDGHREHFRDSLAEFAGLL